MEKQLSLTVRHWLECVDACEFHESARMCRHQEAWDVLPPVIHAASPFAAPAMATGRDRSSLVLFRHGLLNCKPNGFSNDGMHLTMDVLHLWRESMAVTRGFSAQTELEDSSGLVAPVS